MNPDKIRKLKEYTIAIAEILYAEADSEQQFTLEIIEKTIQTQLASVCQSRNCRFFFKQSTGTTSGRTRKLISTLGILKISEKQAKLLGVKPCTRISPHLEQCCLRLSANMSYEQTAVDLEYITGVQTNAMSQQRLVHRQEFQLPIVTGLIEELSVDGGKVRLRTARGLECIYKDYKAMHTNSGLIAGYQDNIGLINWVNSQPIANIVTCLGDGHDGIWNIIGLVAPNGQRREILDWYHLIENLNKVGGSQRRINQAQDYLWMGEVDKAKQLFVNLTKKTAQNFCVYLNKHRSRIVNYHYYQSNKICSIGSGAVESAIKQIGRRIKISGAQWNEQNVPQVLAHRVAYLNGMIGVNLKAAA